MRERLTVHWESECLYCMGSSRSPRPDIVCQWRNKPYLSILLGESKEFFQVDVVREEPFSQEAIEVFQAKMVELLGEDINVRFAFVKEIPRDQSGKMRYFISKLPDGIR